MPNTAPQNDFYTILFESAPIGLGLSDMTGKLVMYNKMMLKISGFTAEDIEEIGYVTKLYYNPEDRQKIIDKTMKEGFVENYPVKFKKKDGSYFEALISLTPVKYNNQPYFLATIQDVTQQLKAERELAEKNAELESMNKMMIGRELKMTELKETVQKLTEQLKNKGN